MKNPIFHFFFICIFLFKLSFSQSNIIDSLKTALQTVKDDTTRVKLLIQLCEEMGNSSMDSAFHYAKIAIKVSQEIDYKKGMALSYSSIGDIYVSIDKLLEALEYYNNGLQIYKEINDHQSIVNAYFMIGSIHFAKQNYQDAIVYFKQGVNVCIKLTDKKTLAKLYNRIGLCYDEQYNIPKSLMYFIKGLKINEELGDKWGIAMSYKNIGNIYLYNLEYQKSMNYYLISLNIIKEIGKEEEIANMYINIGACYEKQEKHITSIHFGQKALQIFKKLNDNYKMAYVYSNIGDSYEMLGNYKKAMNYYLNAFSNFEDLKDKSSLAKVSINIGSLLTTQKNYNKAKYYLILAKTIADSIGSLEIQMNIEQNLYSLYTETGNYKKSLEHYKTFTVLKDSVFNQEKNKQIVETEIKYETEKKEKEIVLLKKEKELQHAQAKSKEVELKQKTFMMYASAGGLLLLLVITYLIFRGYKRKIKSEKKLQKKNDSLNEAYQKLQELEEHKETMMGLIVHDLKNPLAAIMGYTDFSPSEQTIKKIKNSSNQMLNLIQNILDVQKFENTEIKLNTQESLLLSLTEEAINQVEYLYMQKNIILENKLENDFKVKIDDELILRVLVNLLNNAIKFTPSNGTISINANKTDDEGWLQISVKDNGVGIPVDKLDKVFEKFSQVEAKKSGVTRSTGLGLTFCKLVVEAHKGKIWLESEKGKGSTFHFTIPLIEVTEKVTVIKKDNSHIPLTMEERKILVPYLKELTTIKMYEASAVFNIIQKIKLNGNGPSIEQWKKEVEDAVMNYNEERYKELIQSAELCDKEVVKFRTPSQKSEIRVLVVEDNISYQELIKGYLNEDGYNQVTLVNNGLEALKKIKENQFDIILIDKEMPELNGIETTKKINEMEFSKKPVIIGISATYYKEDVDELLNNGMVDYITKPFDKNKLIKKIEKWVV